ncbi:MAG: lytic transglycosylase domain-containing protein [Acidiphilium sp.]|nr:lytic transglycosylase domain-containing protein [Acidiphilium sp.]MDD4934296.1 lytic transglycosylase domain-containing protein [Acidiphilium sp.]
MCRLTVLLAMLFAMANSNAPLAHAAIAAPPMPDAALVQIMDDVRSNDWAEAQSLAAEQPDRLVTKLVTYFRLLDPAEANEVQIGSFMARNPDWPEQGVLARRWSEALAADPDDTTVREECAQRVPATAAADARCAAAFRATDPEKSAKFARRAWIFGYGDPADAAAFLAQYGPMLTPRTNWARFQRFALAGDVSGAAATLALLSPADQATGTAWLALAQGDANADALIASLTPAQQATPALFFAELAAAPDQPSKLALWQSEGEAAERQAVGPARALFWVKRQSFARDLLQANNPKAAYAIAAAARPPSAAQKASRDFLAGFIALRFLHDPTLARPWFLALSRDSTAVITRARAFYWLAQTEDGAAATADLSRAADYPDTYYGQLASVQMDATPAQLGARIRAIATPPITVAQETGFAERELPQVAVLLAEMGAPRRARAFLLRMAEVSPGLDDRYLDARLADGLGQISSAVMIARIAGVAGDMLVGLGWPIPQGLVPTDPPVGGTGVDVILSLIRQESSFDAGAMSGSGAEGLMQLMPGTARMVAAQSGIGLPADGLMGDPQANIALGSAYFATLMNRFGNCLPLAIAAYNAGPHNVENWLTANGDPRLPASAGGVDMITWIEEIPFAETRNYVERVTEGIVVYRALQGNPVRDPIARWLQQP